MHKTNRKRGAFAIWTALCLACVPARAQELFEPSIHWAYASYFGTGWYKLNDRQSAFIFKTAPRWTIGESGFDDDGGRSIQYTLRLPLTIGLSQLSFDDIPGSVDPGNLATLSAGISFDADVPVTERFSVRPNVEVGYGGVIGEDDRAWSYRASMRGRFAFEPERFDWALIFDGGFVGYDASGPGRDRFSFASIAAEFTHPVQWFRSSGGQSLFHWHIKHASFPDRVRVEKGPGEFDVLRDYWEAGAAIGRRDEPIRLWFLRFDRLGLAYSASSSSQLRGVRLVFRSQYEL
ncbi:MAG: hypothetical protein QNI96_05360 [Woeseiaceae bacterium]|nr:hypothetical protein [Woeseiaceae bacterium]